MKFKFAIIGITALLIVLFIKDTIENQFNPLNLVGIIIVAAFLFWIDYKLERPVTKDSIKENIRGKKTK